MTTLYEGAFAKINLTLDVLDKRPDGYHDLRSVMQTISLRDDIEIDVGTGEPWSLLCSVEGIPTDYECECWAIVNKAGVHPMRMTPQPQAIQAQQMRDRIAPVEMELEALRTGDIHLLEQLVLMDPWTKSLKQAQDLVRDILDMPCNAEMKAYFTR